tara:strand:- start:2629 stop:2823 length:195 start_codon:yes stop_codon:yes gene_type:complete
MKSKIFEFFIDRPDPLMVVRTIYGLDETVHLLGDEGVEVMGYLELDEEEIDESEIEYNIDEDWI